MMFLEVGAIIGTLGKLVYDATEEGRKDEKLKREIKELFNEVIVGVGTRAENNNKDKKYKMSFEILEIFKKHYGFDCIISVPPGLNLVDFRKILPSIESAFNAEIIAEYSTKKNSLYMRCHLLNVKDLAPKDNIRFKWGKSFNKFNDNGETYSITKFTDIKNPNLSDKSNEEQIVGYTLRIDIPNQMDYEELLKYEEMLNNKFPKAFIKWNHIKHCAEVDIIFKPLRNSEKFNIIPCKPWEIYAGMTYAYEPIMLDFKLSQGLIIGGQSGSGKTVGLLSGFINLATQHDRNKFRMYIGSISDKQDLRILTKLEQCDYYAKDMTNCLKMLRYLDKENKKRNQIFDKCKKYTTNIFEYNKNNPKTQMPILYFITDEIADFMEEPQDDESMKSMKKEFQSLFWKLARQGRSSGVWIISSSQRGDTKNLEANVKSQFGNKICYYQANISSAQTIFGQGDHLAKRVTKLVKANREFLVEYNEGITIAKSMYLTNTMMEQMVSKYIIKNKEYIKLSANGTIETPKENDKKEDKTEENPLEITNNNQKQDKNNDKLDKNSKKEVNAIEKFKNSVKKDKEANWEKYKNKKKGA